MTDLLVLLTAHFVGDFLLQSDRMATMKSKSFVVMNQHVAVYTLTVVALTVLAQWPLQWPNGPGLSAESVALFAWMTFALHFMTDTTTSRITSKLWFFRFVLAGKRWRDIAEGVASEQEAFYIDKVGNRHWFFVAIGFDQLLHVYALAWAWSVVA